MDLLKVYLSGRVTASRRKRFNPDIPASSNSEAESQDFDIRQMQIHGIQTAIDAKNSLKPVPPLGLSSVVNSTATPPPLNQKPKKRRGSHGISSRSRQLVRDAATLLQEKHGKEQLAFITHTIPPQFVKEVHANWVKILHNLRRRYIRALQKAGLSEELIMVTEYQEERLSTSGIAVLHLHIVFVGRKKRRHWAYDIDCYKEHWKECCETYIENGKDNALWNAATRVESIKKSCAGYLSKYLSKGVSTLATVLQFDSNAFIPPSWHVLTQLLRCEVRRNTRHFEGQSATELFDYLTSNAVELLKFNRYVKVLSVDGRELCVGWYGDLKNKKLFRSVAVFPTLLVA